VQPVFSLANAMLLLCPTCSTVHVLTHHQFWSFLCVPSAQSATAGSSVSLPSTQYACRNLPAPEMNSQLLCECEILVWAAQKVYLLCCFIPAHSFIPVQSVKCSGKKQSELLKAIIRFMKWLYVFWSRIKKMFSIYEIYPPRSKKLSIQTVLFTIRQ
jgi:hypothetical protein